MIREYKSEDKSCMIQILKQGYECINQEDMEFLFSTDNKILIYENTKNGVAGFCSLGYWGEKKENGKLFHYVIPECRNKGIGTALYNAIMEYAKPFHLNIIEAVFRVDVNDATKYYAKRGFKKWYGMHVMRYNGGRQPDCNMEIVPYEDCFFEQYVGAMQNSFYEMREANDFKPYNCVQFSEEQRKSLLEDKGNLFVLLVDGKFAATAAVHAEQTDVLGPVFVSPEFQGKGYGKIITQFAINEALHRGMTEITLEVVEWNQRAVSLYKSLGFEMIQTTNSYRLFQK